MKKPNYLFNKSSIFISIILGLFALSCELFESKKEIPAPPNKINEIEKYSAKEWIEKNKIKLEYLDDNNLRLIFKVMVDSSEKRYFLFPDLKIAKSEILKRAENYSNIYNLDIENSIVAISMIYGDNTSFLAQVKLNSIRNINSDTLFLFDMPNVTFEKKDGIDKTPNQYPRYPVTKKEYLDKIKIGFFLGSTYPRNIQYFVTHLPCGDNDTRLVPQGCRICGKNFVQYINNGIGSDLQLNSLCF